MLGHSLPTRLLFITAVASLCTSAWQASAETVSNPEASSTATTPIAASTTATATTSTTSTSSVASEETTSGSTSIVTVLLVVIPVMLIFAGVVKKILKHRAAARALKHAKTSQVTNNYYAHAQPMGAVLPAETKPIKLQGPNAQQGNVKYAIPAEKLETNVGQNESAFYAQIAAPAQTWPSSQATNQQWGLPFYNAQPMEGSATDQPKKKGWKLFASGMRQVARSIYT